MLKRNSIFLVACLSIAVNSYGQQQKGLSDNDKDKINGIKKELVVSMSSNQKQKGTNMTNVSDRNRIAEMLDKKLSESGMSGDFTADQKQVLIDEIVAKMNDKK